MRALCRLRSTNGEKSPSQEQLHAMRQRSAFLQLFGSPGPGCAQPWLREAIAVAIASRSIHPWIPVEI
jgi:hypothetical protein